jgi:hypothetical protein
MPPRRLKFAINNHREHRAKRGRKEFYHLSRMLRIRRRLSLERIRMIETLREYFYG